MLQGSLKQARRCISDTYSALHRTLLHAMQAQYLSTPYGASNAQLLLLLETNMLLSLAVNQLTASIPDSCPGAIEARTQAWCLNKALQYVSHKVNLHQLSLPAAYTGPQLAPQVMPSILGPPPSAALQQGQQLQHLQQPLQPPPQQQQQQPLQPPPPPLQQQQQQQPSQQAETHWCTIAATAQLLTELLPLLPSPCLARVQHQQQQKHQHMQKLQQALQMQLQQGLALGARRSAGELASPVDPHFVVATVNDCLFPEGFRGCLQQVRSLLRCTVVPDPTLTEAEMQAASSAAAAVTAAEVEGWYVTYRCVLHAPDAVVQHTLGAVCLCEALLRDATASCAAAAQLHADGGLAASSAAGAATAQKLTLACVAAAELFLSWFVEAIAPMIEHDLGTEFPHHRSGFPSAITLAALAAGPGSDLQRQLFSLLCTMVKLGVAPVPALVPKSAADASSSARKKLPIIAAVTALALLGAGAGMHQPDRESHTAASCDSIIAKLPALFILGRTCAAWREEPQTPVDATPTQPLASDDQELWLSLSSMILGGASAAAESESAQSEASDEPPTTGEVVLPPVQQWLQSRSIQEQLVAAGYAPQALPQQLQQAVAEAQAARESAGSSQPETGRFAEEAGEQLQAALSGLFPFAVPCLCNNPLCTNVSGLTELGLVSGRSCVCGGCRVARYCGRECQRAVRKQHKPVCAALAAAAAAAAAADVSSAAAVPPPLAGP